MSLHRILESQPATTYDLSIVGSLISRLHEKGLKQSDQLVLEELISQVVNLLQIDKPLVPHCDPHLLAKTQAQVQRLLHLSTSATIGGSFNQNLIKDLKTHLEGILQRISKIKGSDRSIVKPDELTLLFGIRNMWQMASLILKEEFSDEIKRPVIPSGLGRCVDVETTIHLINCAIRQGFAMDQPDGLAVFLDYEFDSQHLFWRTVSDGIRYTTPANYDLATQFTFDIPHNAAHIAHLSAHPQIDIETYIDDMAHRSYFEAVAVLAEHHLIQAVNDKEDYPQHLFAQLNLANSLGESEFSEWLLAERLYQSRLRLARLLSDVLTLEGMEFSNVVSEVSRRLKLSPEIAHGEVAKYYTQTGLGSIYVLGPQELIRHGIMNPKGAIVSREGAISTWNQFYEQKSSSA